MKSFPSPPPIYSCFLRSFPLLTTSRRSVRSSWQPVERVIMGDKSSDLVQGTLDMLILKTLALEPMHGYGISVRIEQMSKGVFRLNAGSLFLAIQRLERDGLIDGEWNPLRTTGGQGTTP